MSENMQLVISCLPWMGVFAAIGSVFFILLRWSAIVGLEIIMMILGWF